MTSIIPSSGSSSKCKYLIVSLWSFQSIPELGLVGPVAEAGYKDQEDDKVINLNSLFQIPEGANTSLSRRGHSNVCQSWSLIL